MINEDLDGYIVKHYKSLSQAEIARRCGTSEATVSRHVKALKISGSIAVDESESAKLATEAARASLKGSLSRSERIKALQLLRERLTDELGETGGANLARVSSELRNVLAELETLTGEAVSAMVSIKELEESDVCGVMIEAVNECGERAKTADIVSCVLGYLNNAGFVVASPVCVLVGIAQYSNATQAAGAN